MTNESIPNMKDVDTGFEPAYPNAKQVKKDDILGKEIIVKSFKKIKSTKNASGNAVIVLAELDGQDISFFGATALDSALERVKEKLPLKTTIVKEKAKETGKPYFAFG